MEELWRRRLRGIWSVTSSVPDRGYFSTAGSADPYHGLSDPDPDCAPDPVLVSDLQNANIKYFFLGFFAYYF